MVVRQWEQNLGGEWNHLTSVLRELPNPLINFINKINEFYKVKRERKEN